MKADVDPAILVHAFHDVADREAGDPSANHWPASPWEGREILILSPTPTHPLDAGNRRRIFYLTRSLQVMGARIVFAHYPGEFDWRDQMPRAALAAMQAQWDEVHTIPVTRPLHEAAPPGGDHGCDDWWDPAIGDMLRWLFATHRIDVCIVNYTWLTKAFEFCPPGVLKVLDTHDRFSDRRALLARHGIMPEFFHTTRDEERAALQRADVVWSIKQQEAAYFRSLGIRRVVNIPHVEPIEEPPARRLRGKLLRFGIIGARNSINRHNIAAFLEEAVRLVTRTLLPCEIVVAGSVCDLLEESGSPWDGLPWIRLLGRVADVDAFYRDIDVVLAPIAFSTGLKIKVGEALCHGKAVLALAHAFEGFPARHPYHLLPSLPAMLAACRDLVNDPDLVDELERLSLSAVLDTQAEVVSGLADTIAVLDRTRPALCLVAMARDIFTGSLVLDHLLEAAHYLSHRTPLCVFLDDDAKNSSDPVAAAECGALLQLAQIGPVFLAPALFHGAVGAALRTGNAQGLHCQTMADLVRLPHLALWFASCPSPWRGPVALRAYIALDVLALSATPVQMQALLSHAVATFHDVVTVSRRGLGSSTHRVPAFWKGERGQVFVALTQTDSLHESTNGTVSSTARTPSVVIVLADTVDEPLLALTVSLILCLSAHLVRVILPSGIAFAPLPAWADPARVQIVTALHCFAPSQLGAAQLRPAHLFDISTDPALECVREVFDLAQVRSVRLFTGSAAPAHGAWTEPGGARGLFESVSLVHRLLAEEEVLPPPSRADRDDVGWALIWDELTVLIQAEEQRSCRVGTDNADTTTDEPEMVTAEMPE